MKKLLYKLSNWKAYWRAAYLGTTHKVEGILFHRESDNIELLGTLAAKVISPDGRETDLGEIAWRLVTTAGVNYLRDAFANGAGGANIGTFKYHACGTGNTAEAITDTTLVTECTTALNPDSTRGVGTQVNSVAKTYTSVATLTFDSAAAVTEHGLFNQASGGILWDRSVFAVINVDAGGSIQFTYSLSIVDGG